MPRGGQKQVVKMHGKCYRLPTAPIFQHFSHPFSLRAHVLVIPFDKLRHVPAMPGSKHYLFVSKSPGAKVSTKCLIETCFYENKEKQLIIRVLFCQNKLLLSLSVI